MSTSEESPKKHRIRPRALRITLRILLGLVLFVVGLVALVWVALQIPAVQNLVVDKVTKTLSKQLATTVEIGNVNIRFFKTVVVEDVYVADQAQDTLLYVGELSAGIGLLGLSSQQIVLTEVGVERLYANVYRPAGGAFNYQFALDSLAGDTTQTVDTTASAWTFDLEGLRLRDIRLSYRDDLTRDTMQVALSTLDADIRTLGLDSVHPEINRFTIDGLAVSVVQRPPDALPTDTAATATANAPPDTAAPLRSFVEGFALTLHELDFQNINLRYSASDTVAEGVDFANLGVEDLALRVEDILVSDSVVGLALRHFSFRERSGFTLRNLALDARGVFPAAQANLHTLETGHSTLNGELTVSVPDLRATDQLPQTLYASADFEQGRFSMRDAYYFAPDLDSLAPLRNRTLALDGHLAVAEGEARANLSAALDSVLSLQLNAVATQFTDLSKMEVDARVAPLRTSQRFVQSFTAPGTLPPGARRLGELVLNAHLEGTLAQMRGMLDLNSGAGHLQTQFVLNTDTSFASQRVRGTIEADAFDLRAVAGDSAGVGALTLDGTFDVRNDPSGFHADSVLIDLKEFNYNGYAYRDLVAGGHFVDNHGMLALTSADTNLRLDLRATADLQPAQPQFRVALNLDRADLEALNFYDSTLVLATQLQAAVQGTDPNTLTAQLAVRDLTVDMPERYVTDSLLVVVDDSANQRRMSVDADFLVARVRGDFTVEGLPVAIDRFVQAYFSRYEVREATAPPPQTLYADVRLTETPALARAFVPDLSVPAPITLRLGFASEQSSLTLDLDVPSLSYGVQSVSDLRLTADAADNQPLAIDLNADRVRLSESQTITPSVEGKVYRDSTAFKLTVADTTASSRLELVGSFLGRGDTLGLNLDRSELNFNQNEWFITDGARLRYAPDYLYVSNFEIRQAQQRIAIATEPLPQQEANQLKVVLENLRLDSLVALVGLEEYQITGMLEGNATVDDVFNLDRIAAQIDINDLGVDTLVYGDLKVRAEKNQVDDYLSASLNLSGPYQQIDGQGRYTLPTPDAPEALDFQLDAPKINLNQFRPYLQDVVDDFRGTLAAQLRVTGTTAAPRAEGHLRFSENFVVQPLATGVAYDVSNQEIRLDNDKVVFQEFVVHDEGDHPLRFDGQLLLTDLTDPKFDLNISTDNFRFLNASRYDNPLVWGEFFAAADVDLSGPLSDLKVQADVMIKEQTDVFLSVDTESGAPQEAEFIEKVNGRLISTDSALVLLQDTLSADPGLDTVAITGITLEARVETDPKATFNIIIDERTDDKLVDLQGEAVLAVEMTKAGDLSIVGNYEISGGQYAFNFIPALSRTFGIQKNSTIQFQGAPTDIVLDLTAVYETTVSTRQLIPSDDPERRLINVLLNIEGELFEPVISFGIKPETDEFSLFDGVIDQINRDETELNKQVFALIVLDQFLPYEGTGTGGSAGGSAAAQKVDESLSSFLTGQLNDLSDKYLGGIQIDVQYSSGAAQEAGGSGSDLNVNFSKSLFNDRISVSVGTGDLINDDADRVEGSRASTVVGNVVVEYRLDEDGDMNIRFFRRTPTVGIAGGNGTSATAGSSDVIGVSYAQEVDFDRLREIFRKEEEKKRRVDADEAETAAPPTP